MLNFEQFLKFVIPAHISTLGVFGLTGMISGSNKSSKGSLKENIDKSEKEKQTQYQTQTSESQQLASSASLDEETINLVKGLLGGLSAGVQESDSELMNELASTLVSRASTAEEDVASQIAPIISDARLQGEQKLKQLQTQLARQAGGSTANTLVASSTALGRANLESQLARAEGELRLAGREAITQELTSAIQGIGSAQQAPVNNLVNLLNVLKGAQVEQTQTGQQQTVSEAELVRILDSLTARDAYSTSKSKSFDWSLEGTIGNA